MQEQHRLNDQERQIEQTLGRLQPRRTGLSPGGILVEVEHRRAIRQVWTWRGIAACLGAGLAISLLIRPQPVARTVDQPAMQQSAVQQPGRYTQQNTQNKIFFAADAASLTGDDYLSKRDRIFVLGLSALSTPPPTVSPVSVHVETKAANPLDAPLLRFVKPLVTGVQG